MIEGEEFALEQARASDANAERKAPHGTRRSKLQDKLQASIEEEAAERRRGDDRVRRAYEDDIANLEDTAAEAVRELREGLRDEVATRTHQAETLHRRPGLHARQGAVPARADVRALEETAAGNIAAQKLEEEMLRAELDDGLLRVDEALEQLQTDADARAAEALQKLDQHRAAIAASVAEECAPVDARVTALARTSIRSRRGSTRKTEAASTLPRGQTPPLVDAMESAAEETEKAFRQVHGDVAKDRGRSSRRAADRVATDETTRAELEASVEANARRADADAVRYLEEKIVDAETDAKVEAELARAELAADAEDAAEERSRAEQRRRRPQGALRAEMDAKDGRRALRAEMEEAKDQTRHPRDDGGGEGSDASHPRGDGGGEGSDASQSARRRRTRKTGEATRAKRVARRGGQGGGGGGDGREGARAQRGGDGGTRGDVTNAVAALADVEKNVDEIKERRGWGGAVAAGGNAPPAGGRPLAAGEPDAAPEPEPEPEAAPSPSRNRSPSRNQRLLPRRRPLERPSRNPRLLPRRRRERRGARAEEGGDGEKGGVRRHSDGVRAIFANIITIEILNRRLAGEICTQR